jgi:hypothetical protein
MYPSGLGGIAVGTTSNHPYIILANNTERMRVTATGDVGIGTGSPGAKLDISNGQFRLSAAYQVQWFNGATQLGSILCDSGPNLTFQTGSSNTERMRIDSSGNVGIGVTPTVNLDVKNAGGNCVISAQFGTGTKGQLIAASNEVQLKAFNGTNDVLTFATGASERMRITSTGNVGIGTTSPSTALQVSGTITTTGLTSSNTIVGSINGNAATVTNGLYTTGGQTIAARTIQQGSQTATMLTATGSLGGFELLSASASAAAFMTFHRPAAYASYFGIDTDNNFAVGGWSAGAALASMKVGSFGVGTAASGTAGEIRATNNITAYYSDARLKDFKGKIGDALYKVSQLNGYYYTENEKAEEFGYNNKELQVGVSAQEVQAVLPEVVTPAPFDLDADGKSKSGDDYMTVRYEKLVPLLIEAIKELKAEVEALKAGK